MSTFRDFRDNNKSFKLHGDLLKRVTICKFNVGHSNPPDKKIYFICLERN